MSLMRITDLEVAFHFPEHAGGKVRAVRDFNLTIKPGERVGLVGESGAGKSITAFSILNLLKKPGKIEGKDISFQGRSLLQLSPKELDAVRGNEITMIFQDPMVTLNPIMTVGKQLQELLQVHQGMTAKSAEKKVIETLRKVKISSPEKRIHHYPHEFSGGMRQRIVIAAAIITQPRLIISDEPTTALDVTIQSEIIELLYDLSRTEKMALLIISHDLALVSQIAERILVMYAGRVVEENRVEEILRNPRHPYTRGLINCLPQKHAPGERLYQIPGIMPSLHDVPETCAFYDRCHYRQDICKREKLLPTAIGGGKVSCHFPIGEESDEGNAIHLNREGSEVNDRETSTATLPTPEASDSKNLLLLENIHKAFPLPKGILKRIRFSKGRFSLAAPDRVDAINGVNLSVLEGETLCLVGESGCGKSTLARVIMRLLEIDQGKIYYRDKEISKMGRGEFLPYRSKMQMIFQNPFSCLNPRLNIRKTLEQPIKLHFPGYGREAIEDRVATIMKAVGLDPSWLRRYPHEFSGGQRQRIGIARALAVSPEFIIADEPISALDISIQSQILNLLKDLQRQENLTYLFITHNLGVVKYLADRVCIMYLGVVFEIGSGKEIFSNPLHPYTQTLLSAVPAFGKSVNDYIKVKGEITSPINLPEQGCVFADRCLHKKDICTRVTPKLQKMPSGSSVACHLYE